MSLRVCRKGRDRAIPFNCKLGAGHAGACSPFTHRPAPPEHVDGHAVLLAMSRGDQHKDCVASEPGSEAMPTELFFHHVPNDEHGHHRVEAYIRDNLFGTRPVGKIIWRPGDGEVQYVETDHTMRRRGVATALWHEAHVYAHRASLVMPQHSAHQTGEGAAWALNLARQGSEHEVPR